MKECNVRPLKEEGVSEGKRQHRTPRSSGETRIVRLGAAAPAMTVVIRRQTREEQRQWEAAFDIFLAELVRQHLSRE